MKQEPHVSGFSYPSARNSVAAIIRLCKGSYVPWDGWKISLSQIICINFFTDLFI